MSVCNKKLCLLFIFLCKCVFSSELLPEQSIPVYYTADRLEVLFDSAGDSEEVNLQGNVKIAFEDIILRCDSATFEKNTGNIFAQKNLFIETLQGNIKADNITYNLNDRTGVILNAVFSSPPFYGKAEKLEKDGDVLYIVKGYITTCDNENPHYKILAERIKYVKDEYFQAQRMRFVLGEKFSVFYFPRYTVDAKTKEPFVMAKPAHTSYAGENLEIVFAQRTGINQDAVAKERILVGTKGCGAGAGLYSDTQGYRYEGFLFKRWGEGDIEPALFWELLKNYGSDYGGGAFLVDWRYVDNNAFFYDFFHSDYIAKSKTYNYLSFTHNLGQNMFNFNLRDSAEDDFLKIDKFPEIRFSTPFFPIGGSRVFLGNDFQFTNFYKEDDNYIRILDMLTLKQQIQTGVLTVSPYLSLGGVEYLWEEEDKFNFVREAGVGFSSLLKKEHKSFTEYFAPVITCFYRELDYNKGDLEYFDFIEQMESGYFVNIGIDWFFKKENDYMGRVSLGNLYDIEKDRFSVASLKYDIKLTPSVYIEGKNEWDISGKKYLLGVNDIIFNSGKSSYAIGGRYDNESNISGIEGRFGYRSNEFWRYSLGLQYDVNDANIAKTSFNLWRKLHCWELNLSVSASRDDVSFFVMIYPLI